MNTPTAAAVLPAAGQPEGIKLIPRRRWIRLGIGNVILGLVAWWLAPTADPAGWWLHGLWCAAGLAIATPTLLIPFREDFEVTLTEHRVAFVAAYAVFLLFGGVFLAAASESLVERALAYYPISVNQALEVDAINGGGLGLALLVSAFSKGRWLSRITARVSAQVNHLAPKRIIVYTLVAGGIATYYRLAVSWGEGRSVSGVWIIGSQLLLFAILLSAAYRGRGERALRWCAVVLAMLLAVAGALQFMKQAILEPLLALTAGLALRFGARRVLPVGLTALAIFFSVLGDVVSQGRVAGGFYVDRITVAERWRFMVDGWNLSRDVPEEQRYSSWGRLSQVTTEAAAIDFQNTGQGGGGEPAIYWVLIPRFLAPQKPAFLIGSQLHEKITGFSDSSDAVGIFVSGYYYSGWWGFIMASVCSGWIVAQTSAIARAIHGSGALVLLPLSMLGLLIALGTAGDFVAGFLAPFMYILYPLLAAAVILPIWNALGLESSQS